jgi:hypothetical protein
LLSNFEDGLFDPAHEKKKEHQ